MTKETFMSKEEDSANTVNFGERAAADAEPGPTTAEVTRSSGYMEGPAGIPESAAEEGAVRAHRIRISEG
jgi:hypothetical protein